MKRLTLALITLSILGASPLLADEPARPDHVVLGFQEFIQLWTKAQTPKPDPDRPPVDAAITRAEYVGAVHARSTEITATFDVAVLAGDRWVRIPFLPVSAGLKDVRLDGAAVPVVTDGGSHALLVKGAGRHTLRAVFSIATGARDGDPQFNFYTAQTPITLVTLSFTQPDLDVQIDPAQAVSLRRENGGTVAQAILPPTGNVHVAWRRRQPVEKEQPAAVYARLRELLSIDDAALRIQAQVGFTILHSGVDAVSVRVPEGVSVLGVTGEGIQAWRVEKNALVVAFDRKITGERNISIQAERALSGDAAVAAPIFDALDVVRQEISVGVEATGHIEVATDGAAGLRAIDVKELPPELWSLARSPLLYGFTGSAPNGAFSLAVTRHEDVPVLASTVDSANAVTVLTRDGQSVTRVAFYVRNHLKQFLTLDLPDGAEIWSAFVNGRAVKPSRNKAGQILVPLDKSGMGSVDAAFPVEIVYYGRRSPLGLAGRTSPSLPKIDLPISQMLWSVYAPENDRLLYAGGNVDADAGLLPMSGVDVGSIRNESRDDKDAYLERAAKKIRAAVSNKAEDAVASRQAAMEVELAAAAAPAVDETATLADHVLPISFQIPETGHLYRFCKIMVTREAPIVTLTYVRDGMVSFGKGLAIAMGLCLLFLRRRQTKVILLRAVAFGRKMAGHLRPAQPNQAAQ